MRWLTAETQVSGGAKVARSSDPDRIVFVNEHGELVEQRPGRPQFAFSLASEDDKARDWEITLREPGK